MFEGKSIIQVLMMGGYTMFVLILCSILSLAVILERVMLFRKIKKVKRPAFMKKIAAAVERYDYKGAIEYSDAANNPIGRIAKAGIEMKGKGELKISNAMERQIGLEANNLERYTSILGSIGSTVVYIGLFGTVIGIIRAFQDIALTANGAGGGMGMVITGIAEALVSTAAGISVAVPSVIAYNLIMKSVSNITNDLELTASEMTDLLRDK